MTGGEKKPRMTRDKENQQFSGCIAQLLSLTLHPTFVSLQWTCLLLIGFGLVVFPPNLFIFHLLQHLVTVSFTI